MTTPYRQLTQSQRYQIEAGLRAKESQASIAKQVGVHPSTISRTALKRVTWRFQRPMKVMPGEPEHASFASRLPG